MYADLQYKKQESKYPSWCCQKCGAAIGWIGRFIFSGLLHKCKEDMPLLEGVEYYVEHVDSDEHKEINL